MDGKMVHKLSSGQVTTYNGGTKTTLYEAPSLPMRPAFTMWTDTRPVGPFGGRIDPTASYTAAFGNLRQVICDATAPAAATVPTWLA